MDAPISPLASLDAGRADDAALHWLPIGEAAPAADETTVLNGGVTRRWVVGVVLALSVALAVSILLFEAPSANGETAPRDGARTSAAPAWPPLEHASAWGSM